MAAYYNEIGEQVTLSDVLVFFAFGGLAGFGLGYVYAWKLARKLRYHGVELSAWDKPYDANADEPKKAEEPKAVPFGRLG